MKTDRLPNAAQAFLLVGGLAAIADAVLLVVVENEITVSMMGVLEQSAVPKAEYVFPVLLVVVGLVFMYMATLVGEIEDVDEPESSSCPDYGPGDQWEQTHLES